MAALKFEDLHIGTRVVYSRTGRQMVIVALHATDETVTCDYVDSGGETRQLRVAPRFLRSSTA